ncbi:hypothetical protein M434DRAFT_254104 [Hypoxylon sp. CO27-5]|nr:hypothetical protein M434DRAFT_254104 [Hypoxylon sp. CO27-5]
MALRGILIEMSPKYSGHPHRQYIHVDRASLPKFLVQSSPSLVRTGCVAHHLPLTPRHVSGSPPYVRPARTWSGSTAASRTWVPNVLVFFSLPGLLFLRNDAVLYVRHRLYLIIGIWSQFASRVEKWEIGG